MKRKMLYIALILVVLYGGSNAALFCFPARGHSRQLPNQARQAELDRQQQLENDGVAALARKEYAEAERLLTEYVKLDPVSIDGWYHLGRTLEAQGRDQEAFAAYQHTFHPDPSTTSTLEKDPVALGQYGLVCSRLGRWAEAVQFYETAMASVNPLPDMPTPYVQFDRRIHQRKQLEAGLRIVRGIAYFRRDERALSLPEFEAAVRLLPQSAVAQYYLGYSLEQNGRREEALPVLEKAAALGSQEAATLAKKLVPEPAQPAADAG